MSNSCASASLGYKENSYEDKELLPFRGNDKEIVSKRYSHSVQLFWDR